MGRSKVLGAVMGGLAVLGLVLWGIRGFQDAADETANEAQEGVGNVAHARQAPGFELKASNGQVHRLKDLAGKPVVIHFWASWCPPCLGEIPHWLGLTERWKDSSLRFVAVSLDTAWPDALKVLPGSKLLPNTLSVIDPEQKLSEEYGTYQFPETYLLDSRHRIIAKWVGPQDWNRPEIVEALEKVSGRP